MKEFKVGICVRFIYNNSGLEWHVWQTPVYEWLQNQALHCLKKSFGENPCFTTEDSSDKGIRAGIFTKLNADDRVLEVIIDKYRTNND